MNVRTSNQSSYLLYIWSNNTKFCKKKQLISSPGLRSGDKQLGNKLLFQTTSFIKNKIQQRSSFFFVDFSDDEIDLVLEIMNHE